MLTRDLWSELGPKWPNGFWDDWLREPPQRRNRACIRPEISRTKTFGRKGISNGLFFDKHLRFIKLSQSNVDFTKHDLTFLLKDNYDRRLRTLLDRLPVVKMSDLRNINRNESNRSDTPPRAVRILYRTRTEFKNYAKALNLMDDFKAGVPRMAYKGVVSAMNKGLRVYIAPSENWKGYDPSW